MRNVSFIGKGIFNFLFDFNFDIGCDSDEKYGLMKVKIIRVLSENRTEIP
jgi:hypothetical protein